MRVIKMLWLCLLILSLSMGMASAAPLEFTSSQLPTEKLLQIEARRFELKQRVSRSAQRSVTVVVKKGESLSIIAERHDTTAQRLFSKNTFVEDPNLIYAGQKLVIPGPNEKLKTRALPVVTTPVPTAGTTTSTATSSGVWNSLRNCESGGNYQANTGNGYYGAYQFSQSTWSAMGTAYSRADLAPPAVQDQAARELQARSGWGQWPDCSAKLGLR